MYFISESLKQCKRGTAGLGLKIVANRPYKIWSPSFPWDIFICGGGCEWVGGRQRSVNPKSSMRSPNWGEEGVFWSLQIQSQSCLSDVPIVGRVVWSPQIHSHGPWEFPIRGGVEDFKSRFRDSNLEPPRFQSMLKEVKVLTGYLAHQYICPSSCKTGCSDMTNQEYR